MTTDIQGEIVLQHIEATLGQPDEVWRRERDGSLLQFQVLLFRNKPEDGSFCLVTFGLSAHHFEGPKGGILRFELLLCGRSHFDSKALSALLIAVGRYCLGKHSAPGLHGILPGDGAVLDNPKFEHIYWSFPGLLPEEFELCRNVSPPVHFFQLLPISSAERDLIQSLGWREFEDRLCRSRVDVLEFDRREEVS